MSDDDDLVLDHPSEIAALLDALQGQDLQLQAGEQRLDAQLLRHDKEQLWLRLPQEPAAAWLLDAGVHASAELDQVRIDFELGRRELLQQDGRSLLRVAAPLRLRRHQRRQAFRVPALSQHHPRALLDGRRLPALDLSTGGLALLWPAGEAAPVPGELLGPVELELERELRLNTRLRVRHRRLREDGSALLGCAFEALPASAERLLAQQLQKLQHRARIAGR